MSNSKRLQKLAGIINENVAASIEDPNPFDDVPSVRLVIDDSDGNDKAFLEISAMYHSGDNGKMSILKNSPELQQALILAIQQETQNMFRNCVHSLLGEPFGLKQ